MFSFAKEKALRVDYRMAASEPTVLLFWDWNYFSDLA